ncbi:hypothetical protein DRO60_04445 [Candidatus Bathyarchaeota archaeon]|nr:MAG: hypothetical protein DRO60_04445 [Candidatus Bathyarchaeota archaeon]
MSIFYVTAHNRGSRWAEVKVLLIHASEFRWRVKGEARGLKVRDEPRPEEAEFHDVIVAFVAVEEGDEASLGEVVVRAADAIQEFADRLKCKSVVLYPYAHLSTRLARPDIALRALRELAGVLRGRGFEVVRSPFGYYKEFLLYCKGHPLAEAFRDIRPA